jgi:DNA-binding MarR family transcriptional regulator
MMNCVSFPVMSRRRPDPDPVAVALQRLTEAFAARSMQTVLRLDLTMPQFRALRTIWRLDRVNGRDLARALGVTPAAIVLVCDQLQNRGYVERVRDETDRRVWYFQPTATAREAFQGMSDQVRARLGPALARLTATEREHLTRTLTALADALGADATGQSGEVDAG